MLQDRLQGCACGSVADLLLLLLPWEGKGMVRYGCSGGQVT